MLLTLQLAFKNIKSKYKNYIFIYMAMLSAFCIISIITSIAFGSMETIRDKAARYFSGHISITGINTTKKYILDNSIDILESVKTLNIPLATMRSLSIHNNALLFFSGVHIQQRRLIGVDPSIESPFFNGLSFSAGSWSLFSTSSLPGILISTTAAKLLNCQVGDAITINITTDTGQYNSTDLIVQGIFNEASLFGYAAYLRRSDLNKLLQHPDNAATDIAVYLNKGFKIDQTANKIIKKLSNTYHVAPLYKTREDRDIGISSISTPTIVVMTQDAQLAQVKQLIDALLYISYFVMGVFLLIIMIGILNTYRVLIHNRRREIGILRSLGMKHYQVTMMILQEAALLSFFSTILGLAFSALLLRYFSTLNLSAIPGAALFMENGHLRLILDPKLCVLNFAFILSSALVAVWEPACKASRIPPTEAMRSA